MSHRINIILDDDIWESLQAVPKGERSPLVNHAIAAWLVHKNRHARLIDPKGSITGTTVFALDQSVRRYRCPKLGA